MQGWVEIGPVVLEEKISKFVNVFSLFRYYLPLEKGVVLYINKLERTSPKNILSQVWLKLAQWIKRRRFLNCFVMTSPLKKVALFIWKKTWIPFIKVFKNVFYPLGKQWGSLFGPNWIPLTQGCQVGWNWPSGSGEE